MDMQGTRVDTLHRLHATGCFVMPNPWDVGSARVLEQLGFEALATTSVHWACGGAMWAAPLPAPPGTGS
jgi:2-methylisocitrate lyase-like PEP mutase family enzyme